MTFAIIKQYGTTPAYDCIFVVIVCFFEVNCKKTPKEF